MYYAECDVFPEVEDKMPQIATTSEVKNQEETLSDFVHQCGRKIYTTVGDGCCLFRSLSHQLFSSEDQHSFILELLQRFENLNEAVFSPFLMELNAKEFKDHIHQLSIPWSMGTHIELLAFATYFKAPIYIAQKMGRGHNWRVVKPLSVNASLRFPFLTWTHQTLIHYSLPM